MDIYSGKSVFPGVSWGTVYLLQKPDLLVDESPSDSPDEEWAAFEAAKKQADDQLAALFEKTSREIGEEEALIIDIQRMMLEDGDLNDAIEWSIKKESRRAAHAVAVVGKRFSELFAALDDPYMKARAPDVADAARRLTAILLGKKLDLSIDRPSVIVAEDLSPSETLQLDRRFIRAFVTRKGSTNSHTAILARTLKIPALVQSDIPLDGGIEGKEAAVDGHEELVYLEPDGETLERLALRQKQDREKVELLERLRGLPTVTKGGRSLGLYANIGSVEDAKAALAADAEGIGLFRTEFLYLGRGSYPGEEEQFEAYREVAEIMGGRRVIIRTMDIGADKKVEYFGLEGEENPALGFRAIRICFDRPELFKTQLRAIYRASAFGNVAIMFPMIASLWELRRAKEFAAEARQELLAEGKAAGNLPLGIMVETPAAALLADEFAREADFFSVGTNDLTQYTLAADRQNQKLEPFADPRHPAVLKFLEMIAGSARKAGIWAGICGELASDRELTGRFLDMGYQELSVSPAFILEMRGRIREMD
jgi:phosphotransferase system enzyme I (PtsI)